MPRLCWWRSNIGVSLLPSLFLSYVAAVNVPCVPLVSSLCFNFVACADVRVPGSSLLPSLCLTFAATDDARVPSFPFLRSVSVTSSVAAHRLIRDVVILILPNLCVTSATAETF